MAVTARRISTVERRTVPPDPHSDPRIEADVVAELVHELCGPLTSVDRTVELLLGSFDSIDRNEAHTLLRRVHDATRWLQDVLANLTLAPPGRAERQLMTIRPTNLGRCVERVLPVVQALLDRKQQRVVIAYPPRPAMVWGDEHLIRRIVVNLLTNAAKYGRVGDLIQISISTNARWVIVQVRDHGRGIDAEDLEYIFEPYARGASASSEDGTGLGLSIVKTLVERHGGHVGVRSEPSRGTTFWFSLPRLGSRRASATAGLRTPRPIRRETPG